MRKFLVNIIALLLIIVIPVSATGIEVSVYKCMHRGLVLVSFYGLAGKEIAKCECTHESQNKIDDTTCSGCESDEVESTGTCSGCESDEVVEQSASCCETEAITSSLTIQNDFDNTGSHYDNIPCCSTSSDYYSLNIESPTPEIHSFNLYCTMPLPNTFFLFEINKPETSQVQAKEKIYPLDVPIKQILSYIAYSSNSTADDYLS